MKRPKSGASGIGDILKGLGELVDRLSELDRLSEVDRQGEVDRLSEVDRQGEVDGERKMEQGAESGSADELRRSGSFRGADGRVRGIFGVNVKVGLGAKEIHMEPFGHVRSVDETSIGANSRQANIHEIREPLCDVFDEASEIVIVAEMPGVAAKDVQIEVEGDLLSFSAANAERRYAKELQLPQAVQAAEAKISANNGVVEIRCPKIPL